MTLPASTRYKLYQPVVSTDQFAVSFPLFSNDDITVYVDGVETASYSITASYLDGVSNDAEITLASAVSGVDVEIYGTRTPRREANYLGNSPNLAINLQLDADKLTAQQQELARDYQSTIRVSPRSPVVSPLVADADERKNKSIIFNTDGTGLTLGPTSEQIALAQSYASAAEAAKDRVEDLVEGVSYRSVDLLLASEEPSRGEGAVWLAGGYRYEEAASGATDHHRATVGGVKLYVLPVVGADYAAAAFGITTGSDQAAAIQNAYDSIMNAGGGRLFFGIGTFAIGTALNLASGATETFNQGPEIICAGALTVFDNQVSSGAMFDISAGGTPGSNFLRGGGIKGGKIVSTTGADQVGIRLSTAYQFYLDGIHIDGLDGTGVDVVCALGDNDGSNMLRMSHMRVENCSGWGIDLKGDSGRNETSFVMMSQCFIQANGTDEYKTITGITQANPGVVTAAAHGFSNGDKVIFFGIGGMVELNSNVYTVANATTNTFEISGTDTTSFTAFTSGGQVGPHIPSSGNIRAKMQMLTMNQCAVVLGENVGLFIPGDAGLGQGVFMYDTTFEHNKKRHILSTGVKALKGKNVQFYSNDSAPCMGAVELDASSYTIANVDIDGVVLRATSGNDTYTAFKVYGANADFGTISVSGVDYDDFGYSGQVKQSGFQNDPVVSANQVGALSIGNSIAAVPFDTEVSDLQSRYNPANGQWAINYPTTARFSGKLMITGLTAGDTVTIQLYEVETATILGEEIHVAGGLSSETFKFDFTTGVGATGLTRSYAVRASQDNSGGSRPLDVTNAYNSALDVKRVSTGAI